MDNYNPEFMEQISQEEVERMSIIARENEDKWLKEYIVHLQNDRYWDVEFVDYKCYKVFVSEYVEDITHYRDDFIKNGGSISFEDASWGLYYIATKQEHKFIKDRAEA